MPLISSHIVAPTSITPRGLIHISADGRKLVIHGYIDSRTFADLAKVNIRRVNTLFVSGLGGETAPTLKIASELAGQISVVYVDGPCISACAQYLAPLGRKIVLNKGAVLVFHNTASSIYMMSSLLHDQHLNAYYRRLSQQENALYLKLGINRVMLLAPQYQIRTICVKAGYLPSGKIDAFFASNYKGAVFSSDQLKSFGFNIVGGFYQSPLIVASLLSTSLHKDVPPSAFIDFSSFDSLSYYEKELKSVPLC